MIYYPREDSYLLKKYIERYAGGKKVLDMGAGSGIQALAALKSEAKEVVASDIEKEAVEYCKSLGINTINSNLFEKIKEKFDLIIFNPPYLPKNYKEDKENAIALSGGKRGDEIIIKFLKEAKKHLNKNGKILIIVSSLTPRRKIISLLNKLKMTNNVLEKQSFFMETLECWELNFVV